MPMPINSPQYVIDRSIDSSPGQEPWLLQERANSSWYRHHKWRQFTQRAGQKHLLRHRRISLLLTAAAPSRTELALHSSSVTPYHTGCSPARWLGSRDERSLPSSVRGPLQYDPDSAIIFVQILLITRPELPPPVPAQAISPAHPVPTAHTPPLLLQYNQTLPHVPAPRGAACVQQSLRSPPHIPRGKMEEY